MVELEYRHFKVIRDETAGIERVYELDIEKGDWNLVWSTN